MSTGSEIFNAMPLGFRAERLAESMDSVASLVRSEDYRSAIRVLGNFQESYSEMVADVIQAAYDDGMTKKAICEWLGLSRNTLAGLVKS